MGTLERIGRTALDLIKHDETWRTGLIALVLGFLAMGGVGGFKSTFFSGPRKPSLVSPPSTGTGDPSARTVVLKAIEVTPAFTLDDDIVLPVPPLTPAATEPAPRWRYGPSGNELRPVSKNPD